MKPRANDLDGKTWTRYSLSVWDDIRKTPEEMALSHPAMFPLELALRLIRIFTNAEQRTILDPFAGVGTTAIAAELLGKRGIGVELNPAFIAVAQDRPRQLPLPDEASSMAGGGGTSCFVQGDARRLTELVSEPVDLVITSPPYWDILTRRRTADSKDIRNYGEETDDLGRVPDYAQFLDELSKVFAGCFALLRPGSYCIVVVMDIRKKNRFYPFHADIADRMVSLGFTFDDIIVWDRRREYNNLRPLGYPYVFRVNKAHEFILIFQKPET